MKIYNTADINGLKVEYYVSHWPIETLNNPKIYHWYLEDFYFFETILVFCFVKLTETLQDNCQNEI